MAILKVENISHSYQDGDGIRNILNQIDYEFEKGKMYTIAGPSGSGKTTFLSIIAGLDKPSDGKVYFDNQDIEKKGLRKYRKIDVSIVFQSYNLINYMTALENVITAMEISGDLIDKKKIAKQTLLDVGLDENKMNRVVSKLSGGEQQRVAIARSIATNPELILADEPTGNLDSSTEQDIISIFKELAHKNNKCVIVVTHSSSVEEEADINIRIKKNKFESKENVA